MIELFYSVLSEGIHKACVGGHRGFLAGLLVSGHATFFCSRENLALVASEDDEIVVHADEENVALFGVGMRCDSQKVILALVGWNLWDCEGAGFTIAGTALETVVIEDVTVVAAEVDAAANHADEEGLAVILTTHHAEKFFGAVNFLLRACGREGKGDQS